MEELESSAVQTPEPERMAPWWYEGVTFEDAKIFIKSNIMSAARSFIAIGYYLKVVRDKEMYLEDGHATIWDFAKTEFGISMSTASRYMTMNDRFSKDGNSPVVADGYKEFGKSQLQEMLSLTDEQLEQVKPSDRVEDIRNMRKPKEIPYVAIPGQVELSDFPGIEPEDVAAASKAREEATASQTEKQAYTISAEDLLPDPETQELEQSIAISQQEPEPEPEVLHFIAGDRTIDNAYGATIAAVVRAYLDSGYSRPARECEVTAFGLVYKVLKRQDVTVFYTDTGRTVFDIENARLEEEYQYWHGTKAEPAPAKQTPAEPEQDSCPPGITDCRRQEWGTGPEEQEAGKKECKACWASWKRQHKALGAAAVEQEPEEEQKDDRMVRCEVLTYMCDSLCGMYAYMLEKNRYSMASIEKISGSDFSFGFGDDGHGHSRYSADCKECRYYVEEFEGPGKWVFKAGEIEQHIYNFNARKWHEGHPKQESKQPETEDIVQESGTTVSEPNPPEDVIDGEFTEIPEPDASDQEAQMTELQIAKEELERAKRLLEKGLGCDVDENDILIRRLKTTVCAWASYVCDLDSIVNPPPKPVQPELPLLKNNDQRAAFVDAYETWPLWIETEQTGERYYRYDLEDGTSMVVKVYHARIFDGYTPGSYEAQYHDGYGRQEYYLLQAGKFFRDCETNRSLLIEKLKEIQKLKKG